MKEKYVSAFLDMAERFGQTSEATRLKVGALIVRDGKILSCGCNGQPPGWSFEFCEDDEGNTLKSVRHAEVAALEKLWQSTETATGAAMFISHAPCKECCIKMLTAGIEKVYYKHPYRLADGIEYLRLKGVEVIQYA